MKRIFGFALAFTAGATWAGGLTVTDAWKAAMVHDPAFAAAQAQWAAGQAHAAEGRAMWMPTLAATGSAGRSSLQSETSGAAFSAPGIAGTNGVNFRTSVNGGTATRWALVAEQPLYDMARLASSTAQKDTALAAEAEYHLARQDLMIRSASRYFDVLNARAQLDSLIRLHAAAENARAAAEARYNAGDIPATDMREAQAAADSIGVQELDTRTALTLAEASFSDLTGLDAAALADLPESATADLPAPDALEIWTERALSDSPQMAIKRLMVSTANTEVARYGSLTSTQVSLIAQVRRDSLHGNGDFGVAQITGRDASIGVQATIPLFTGGMRTAQRHEAQARERQAQAELQSAEQDIRQRTRASWLALTTAAARVQALQRLRGSAARRLDATKLGVEIGGRTALELLNAQADALRAAADFRRAQTQWLLAGLQLQAMAGRMTVADLANLDCRLSPVSTETKCQ